MPAPYGFLPRHENFLFCLNSRNAMLFLSVLSITSGAVFMSAAVQLKDATLETSLNQMKTLSQKESVEAFVTTAVPGMIVIMGFLFIGAGLTLMRGTLTGSVDTAQTYIGVKLAALALGALLALAAAAECFFSRDQCLMARVELRHAAQAALLFAGYLLFWAYFLGVVNGYIDYELAK